MFNSPHKRDLRWAFTRGLGLAILVSALAVCATAMAAPAELDPSFGKHGITIVPSNVACPSGCHGIGVSGSDADALALQADGGLVLGGWDYLGHPGVSGSALAQVAANGALDPSFGSDGLSESTPGYLISQLQTIPGRGLLALLTNEGQEEIALARYTMGGVLESTLGSHGPLRLAESRGRVREATATVDPSQRIDVFAEDARGDASVARFLPSGAPDTSFGVDGVASLPALHGATNVALAAESDGSVIVVAIAQRILVEHLAPAGRLDRSFGDLGTAIIPIKLPPQAGHRPSLTVGVAPSHNILLAIGGHALSAPPRAGRGPLIVVDYTAKGHLDRTFGKGGLARSALVGNPKRFPDVRPTALAFDAAGDAVVVGERPEPKRDVPGGEWFLARYTPRGRDCSFGGGHIVLGGITGGANAVALQPDGHIVIAGWGTLPQSSAQNVMVARYVGGGRPRTCSSE